jgi:amino acid adenylation domain-containing protein
MGQSNALPEVKKLRSDAVKRVRLSPQQRRLWSLLPGSLNHQALCALLIEGKLDKDVLRNALEVVVQRHEILRTTFHQSPEMSIPMQVISEQCILYWCAYDLSDLDRLQQDAQVEELFDQNRICSFDLDRGPLMRPFLLALSPTEQILVIALPALCADARTIENLVREIAQAYDACLQTKAILDEPLQYAQFSEWQHEILKTDDGGEGRRYWNREDPSSVVPLSLPFEKQPSGDSEFAPHLLTYVFDAVTRSKIEAITRMCNTSGAVLLLTCWQTLLWRLTGQSEISISMLCDCRVYEEMETALGLYASWPPVLIRFEMNFRFAEVLERVNDAVARTQEWQEYYSPATDSALSERSIDPAFLFPIGFERVRWPKAVSVAGVKFSIRKQYQYTDRLKLKLSCIEGEDALTIEFHYAPAFYERNDVQRLSDRFLTLLQVVIEDVHVLISDAAILDQAERRQLLVEWNKTKVEYPHDRCIHELLEAQVEQTPDAAALLFGEERLTFGELNHRANQLAHYLRRLGVRCESRVGLFLERSVEMIVGLLGILKAGAAYIPLDPRQPISRITYILDDAQAAVLLTQHRLSDKLGEASAKVIRLDTEWERMARESDANLNVDISADNLAYTIYTSGSTGRPKGVMVRHASVVNLTTGLKEAIYNDLGLPLRIGLNAPLAFDASVKQWVQLLNGHCLHILPEDVRFDIDRMLSWLRQYPLDVLDCTPAQLRLMLAAGLTEMPESAPALMLVGGEAIDNNTWKVLAESANAQYFNVYGPTECTVDSTIIQVMEKLALPTIGRPIANVEVYVLDAHFNPTPIGVPGELYIGGLGLARGYHDRPDLTAEKFIPNLFSKDPGARLYRTGDLVRYLPDANIEILGRLDDQVKIRGNRVEPGEIESVLGRHPSVSSCIVLARENDKGEKRLIAYVVPRISKRMADQRAGHKVNGDALESHDFDIHEHDKGLEINDRPIRTDLVEGELRNYLLKHLSEYMTPSSFIVLDELPLTRNGKIDRHALSMLEHAQAEPPGTCEWAISPIEEMLTGIWGEILGVQYVGIGDNFFELGGHSLMATQLMSQVRQAFQVELPLRALFEAPTVAGLSVVVEKAMQNGSGLEAPPFKQVPRDRELPLSFAQQGLWFLNQLEPGSVAYNIPIGLRLRGELNRRALRQSMDEMVRRHEVLRTCFPPSEQGPIQKIAPELELKIEEVDLRGLGDQQRSEQTEREIQAEANKGFDLEQGPLLRMKLLQLSDEENVLLITTHHIICDGWSIGIMTREFSKLYEAYVNDEDAEPVLPELKIQYADYTVWQREWLRDGALENQLEYWEKTLEGLQELKLALEQPSVNKLKDNAGFLKFELGRDLTGCLKKIGIGQGITLYMTLLAAFQVVIAEYTGREDIVIGTDIANRTHREVEGLIGYFVNQLVLRTDLSGEITFRDLLKRVRQVALEAYQYQHAPFVKVVERLNAGRNSNQAALFAVKFVLQNTPAEAIVLQGLQIEPVEIKRRDAKFDLMLTLSTHGEGLIGVIEYRKNLYSHGTVRMIQNLFKQTLSEIASRPDVTVAALKRNLNASRMSYRVAIKSELKQASARNLLSTRRRYAH